MYTVYDHLHSHHLKIPWGGTDRLREDSRSWIVILCRPQLKSLQKHRRHTAVMRNCGHGVRRWSALSLWTRTCRYPGGM